MEREFTADDVVQGNVDDGLLAVRRDPECA